MELHTNNEALPFYKFMDFQKALHTGTLPLTKLGKITKEAIKEPLSEQ